MQINFQAERDGSNEYADYQPGSLNTTDRLIEDLENYDIVFHIGDLPYANGYISQWDQFTAQVGPIASAVPYMIARLICMHFSTSCLSKYLACVCFVSITAAAITSVIGQIQVRFTILQIRVENAVCLLRPCTTSLQKIEPSSGIHGMHALQL